MLNVSRSIIQIFISLASLRWNLRKCYLPLHLHHPSLAIMVVSCVTGPLTRMLVKPWWLWNCSSSWEHAQVLGLIVGINCIALSVSSAMLWSFQTVNSLSVVGFFPVTRIIPSICILFPACTANVSFYHGSLPFPVISKFIHYVVFNKVIHIIQVWVCHSTDPLQTIARELS